MKGRVDRSRTMETHIVEESKELETSVKIKSTDPLRLDKQVACGNRN